MTLPIGAGILDRGKGCLTTAQTWSAGSSSWKKISHVTTPTMCFASYLPDAFLNPMSQVDFLYREDNVYRGQCKFLTFLSVNLKCHISHSKLINSPSGSSNNSFGILIKSIGQGFMTSGGLGTSGPLGLLN